MSPARRPNFAARARTSRTWCIAPTGSRAAMKIASAFRAANSRPRSEEPAWNSTGVRCGEGSERCGPTTSG